MAITHFLQHRYAIMFVWMLAALLLINPALPALAQMKDDCVAKLKDAEQRFYNGDFDTSIALVKECLGKADFPDAKKKDAYELLAQNYLAKSYLSEARNAIRKLLTLIPDYTPPKDSPELTAEVESVKKEMSDAKKTEVAPPAQQQAVDEGGFPQTWHYIVGGAVVGGVAALLLLKKSEDESPAAVPLPDPPRIP
jgi:hypothetical protein